MKKIGENPFGLEVNNLKSILRLISSELECSVRDIVDFELSLVDVQPAKLVGIHQEFLSAER